MSAKSKEGAKKRPVGKPKGPDKKPINVYLLEDVAEVFKDEASKISTQTKICENLITDWLIERGRLDKDGKIIK